MIHGHNFEMLKIAKSCISCKGEWKVLIKLQRNEEKGVSR